MVIGPKTRFILATCNEYWWSSEERLLKKTSYFSVPNLNPLWYVAELGGDGGTGISRQVSMSFKVSIHAIGGVKCIRFASSYSLQP